MQTQTKEKFIEIYKFTLTLIIFFALFFVNSMARSNPNNSQLSPYISSDKTSVSTLETASYEIEMALSAEESYFNDVLNSQNYSQLARNLYLWNSSLIELNYSLDNLLDLLKPNVQYLSCRRSHKSAYNSNNDVTHQFRILDKTNNYLYCTGTITYFETTQVFYNKLRSFVFRNLENSEIPNLNQNLIGISDFSAISVSLSSANETETRRISTLIPSVNLNIDSIEQVYKKLTQLSPWLVERDIREQHARTRSHRKSSWISQANRSPREINRNNKLTKLKIKIKKDLIQEKL